MRSVASEGPFATLRCYPGRGPSARGKFVGRAHGEVREHELGGAAGRCLGQTHGDDGVRALVGTARFGRPCGQCRDVCGRLGDRHRLGGRGRERACELAIALLLLARA